MSPKNARLKTNGDQSSSASIRTDAILGVEVSVVRVRSEASSLLGRHTHGSAYPWIKLYQEDYGIWIIQINYLNKIRGLKLAWRERSRFCLPVDLNSEYIFQNSDNWWIVVTTSRAESARKYHSFTFYLLFPTNKSKHLNQRPQACGRHVYSAYPSWRARSRFCLPVDLDIVVW